MKLFTPCLASQQERKYVKTRYTSQRARLYSVGTSLWNVDSGMLFHLGMWYGVVLFLGDRGGASHRYICRAIVYAHTSCLIARIHLLVYKVFWTQVFPPLWLPELMPYFFLQRDKVALKSTSNALLGALRAKKEHIWNTLGHILRSLCFFILAATCFWWIQLCDLATFSRISKNMKNRQCEALLTDRRGLQLPRNVIRHFYHRD